MPIDYSKWDKLELSDDDDFECHPNVDKASFIRWKQADIHQKREERRQKIQALNQKIAQNEVLLSRIDDMIKQIEKDGVEAFLKSINKLREANSKLENETKNDESTDQEDKPLKYPTFDQMMAMLFDKIQSEINNESPEEVGDELVRKLKEHYNKLSKDQKETKIELEKEEREAKKKITIDDMHTGFDSSVVNKAKKMVIPKTKKKEKSIEVLNPDAKLKPLEAKEFAAITSYDESYKFITNHPEVVDQDISDQILGEAFRAQLKGKDKYAKQCVHQGWLLQYCQKLGKDGVTLFFRRITSPDPQAREVFIKDVNETYDRIRERCKVMNAEKTQRPQKAQVEHIQIEVTDPNTSLSVRIPDGNSEDEKEKAKYQSFLKLPENFQEALKTGELTKINKVLGAMTVEEAERVLDICGEADVLSLEGGIIDATQGQTIPGQIIDKDE
ncbi:6088_t:CDS:2 [Cetraspora pellucida]|uniref:Hsp90 chaperone protein kinase-targeting subunit n=1 Tax=Cetraspora pellucida TaxID=1433469 RepID=A0A9N9BDY2_9GLOM|nr:6088_t:CDS:2 [Cetraspora pellucida]